MPEDIETTLDIASLLGRIFDGETLDSDRAKDVMGLLMDGKLSQMQAAALLAALRTRGETVAEIIGFAEAMRERAIRVPVNVSGPLLDTCGTGGTGLDTLNISTTASFIVAAAGVKVAKHGNRGVTRRSGAADVLEALGARLDQPPEQLAASIEHTNLAFIFARNHHPAMRFVAPIRADLQARTIFNSLGPLTNPAGANRQLLGVFDPSLTEMLARVLAGLGVERAMVVHGDGLDDVTVTAETLVAELSHGTVASYRVTPEAVGLKRYPVDELAGGDAVHNARLLKDVLAGREGGARRDVVLFSAAAALHVADKAPDLAEGVRLAAEIVDSGAALDKLDEYLRFTARS